MQWKCSRCGECCYSPRIFKKDIKRLMKSGIKQEEFLYRDEIGNTYLKDKEGKCMFLLMKNGKAECSIYEFRPDTCRLYPSELVDGKDCKPVKLAFDDYLEKKRKENNEQDGKNS